MIESREVDVSICVCMCASGTKYLLTSFQGDTNGLATIPVVSAVRNYATARLLFGSLLLLATV